MTTWLRADRQRLHWTAAGVASMAVGEVGLRSACILWSLGEKRVE
jgi:hypothetical protein